MAEHIPITRSVLTWARKRSGFTIEELTKSFTKYEEWESGDSFPTYRQLEALSDKFKCPIAVFLFPEPPDLEPIETSFRTLPDIEFEYMSSKVRMLLRKAKSMQLNLLEMNEGNNTATKFIVRDIQINPNRSINKIATDIRLYMGVTLEEQCSWKNLEETFEKWRNILTIHGVYVFKDAFRDKSYSGFCLYDDQFPIIFVNNTNAISRQIFTLFHELAHLLLRTSGIDKDNENYIDTLDVEEKRIEIFANEFAGAFLVPQADFLKSIKNGEINDENISTLAKKYNVSREVILRKYLNMGEITNSFYEAKVSEWAKKQKTKGDGGDYYFTQIAYLGHSYINLALHKYKQNKIDATQVSDYLNIKPKYLDKFEDKYNSLDNARQE